MDNSLSKPLALAALASFTGLVLIALIGISISRTTHVHAASSGPNQPVLVELFTSEGCSSCPPADALLAQLDARQFVPGAEAIVLSEHVTYWNSLGWHDPFSSETFTGRQTTYGNRFGLDSVYTPQAVVDGSQELVGSDRHALIRAVQAAAAKPKIPLTLENIQWSGNAITAQLTTGASDAASTKGAQLMAALADDSDRSSVLRGENEGRNLLHVAVVRTLVELRKTTGPLDHQPIQVNLPSGPQQTKMRLIVFLADPHSGHILGATMQTIARP